MKVYIVTQHYGLMSASLDNIYCCKEDADERAKALRDDYEKEYGETILYFVMVTEKDVL